MVFSISLHHYYFRILLILSAADSSTPPITSDDSISITSEDSYDLTASQQDLRVLHKRMVEERKKEQEAANKEQQRLDDILNICATYQREMEEEMVKQHGGTASGDGGAGHGVARSESRYIFFFLGSS